MGIDIIEIDRGLHERFYNIIDRISSSVIGYMFTIDNHVAYEVYPEYRGKGIATMALKIITERINRPMLEITYNNLASIRVAEKAGYKLVRMEKSLLLYEYSKSEKRSR